MHIYFCADNKYIPFTSVTITSILKNANKTDELFFHIIGDDIKDSTKSKLNELKSIKNFDIEFLDVDPSIFDSLKGKIDMGYLSMACFYRLLIPKLAPKGVTKALYLDGDMIVRGSLKPLFEKDIKNFMAAVVEEKGVDTQIANLNLKNKQYFNSGMLLLNIDEINKTNLLEDAFEYFLNNHHKFICRDQDILNGIWNGKVMFINDTYNTVSFNKKAKNPLIFHFTGFMKKPWRYFSKSPYKAEWISYLQLGPYKHTTLSLIKFNIKGFLSRLLFIIKDPTHKNYYIAQLLGLKFGLGKKDDKNK
jgi:lipopolysaccharide biosynthesis glycosyltransferase